MMITDNNDIINELIQLLNSGYERESMSEEELYDDEEDDDYVSHNPKSYLYEDTSSFAESMFDCITKINDAHFGKMSEIVLNEPDPLFIYLDITFTKHKRLRTIFDLKEEEVYLINGELDGKEYKQSRIDINEAHLYINDFLRLMVSDVVYK